ncbi:MAG: hypothetical protein NC218_11010 [Acetobacter sp.]|nr:hypothetical protein [Acetobacter sp.]
MEEKKNKKTVGTVVAAGFVGISIVLAAPVFAIAWLGKKGLEALGVEDTPRDDVNPYDM